VSESAAPSRGAGLSMAMGWFWVGYPRVSGLAGLGLVWIFRLRFSGSELRNLSGSVSGLVFHPWITEISHYELKFMFYYILIILFYLYTILS
jgi:hypothetical protein